jgi:hypothetical protein
MQNVMDKESRGLSKSPGLIKKAGAYQAKLKSNSKS